MPTPKVAPFRVENPEHRDGSREGMGAGSNKVFILHQLGCYFRIQIALKDVNVLLS